MGCVFVNVESEMCFCGCQECDVFLWMLRVGCVFEDVESRMCFCGC